MPSPDLTPKKMHKIMYGEHAEHIPCWMYVQDAGDGGISFVGASRDRSLLYGAGKTHTFILGEAIIRPHLAVASNRYTGHGLAGLIRADHPEFLSAEDRLIICDHLCQIPKLDKEQES